MKYYFVILLAVFIGLSANLVHADTGALLGAAGGSVAPYQEQSIKMDSEHVGMVISAESNYEKSANVVVDYELRNTSNKSITLLTGFPERNYSGGSGGALENFRAFIEGKEAATQFQSQDATQYRRTTGDYTVGWHTYTLSFAPNQTLHVKNSYRQNPYGYEGSRGYGGTFEYILDTGASWQGTIDQAIIDIELKNDSLFDVNSLAPIYPDNSWTISPDFKKLSLTLRDIKPTVNDNIVLTFASAAVYNTFFDCQDRVQDIKDSNNPEIATATSYKSIDRQLQYRPDNPSPDYDLPFAPTDIAYFPCEAADGGKRSAWISGDPSAMPGKNQVLTLRHIPTDRSYNSLYLLSGFLTDSFANDKNHSGYRAYSRPKKIKLNFFASKDEAQPQDTLILDVPDNPKGTVLPFNKWITAHGQAGTYINLEVMEAYKGEKYPNIAIAEVDLNGIPAAISQQLISDQFLTSVDLGTPTTPESNTMATQNNGISTTAKPNANATQNNFKENIWKYFSAAEFGVIILLSGAIVYNFRKKRQG